MRGTLLSIIWPVPPTTNEVKTRENKDMEDLRKLEMQAGAALLTTVVPYMHWRWQIWCYPFAESFVIVVISSAISRLICGKFCFEGYATEVYHWDSWCTTSFWSGTLRNEAAKHAGSYQYGSFTCHSYEYIVSHWRCLLTKLYIAYWNPYVSVEIHKALYIHVLTSPRLACLKRWSVHKLVK